MANIYSVKDGGDYHFDDPNAWEGGVVPGPNDAAYIRHNFTQINSGSGIYHWTGTVPSIRVDSTQYLPDSGSFYTYIEPEVKQIKIDYESKDSSYLYTCSIDQSYYDWQQGESGSNIGIIRNDSRVHDKSTTIYLSGSAVWEVMRVIVEDQAEFIIKDQATLRLNSTSGDSYVYVVDGIFKAFDEITCEITGSTRRNSGFITSAGSRFSQILVSGSSDPRAKTTTTAQVSAGSATIPVTDSSQFGEGDLISLYTIEDSEPQVNFTLNNMYDPYQYRESGSVFPYMYRKKFKDEDETVQVVGSGNGELYVKKMFGKEGEVISSTNTETRGSFQRKHKKVSKNFTGTKTSIVVRSGHNDFNAGESIVVDGNIYTILESAKKLIPHKTIDFSQGTGLQDFFVDEMIGSGSDDSYKVNSHMRSGSFLTLDKELIGTNSYYKSFYLKNTRLRDARITLSGSVLDESGSYDGNRMVGVSFGDETYQRDRRLPFYDRYQYANECFIGVYGDDLRLGRLSHDGHYMDTRNYEEYGGVDTTQSSFEVSIDRFKENADYYFNGDFLINFQAIFLDSDVGIHLRREGAQIHKLVVEEYVQELLLDTSDNISVGSTVHEGGTLIDHPANQSIVKIASKIKDLRGYTDLFAQRSLGNISGSFVPLFWRNNGNQTYYRNSDTTHEYGRMDGALRAHPWNAYFRVLSSGDRYFDVNLTEDVTFDAIGISHQYASNNAYLKGFGVEVSNDGHTWTVVRAQADDTRVGGGASNHRIYRLVETTARFIRIRVNGGSASANNYINNLSLHHFNGRGTTIELNNTSDYPVGAKIMFIDPQGFSNHGYNYRRHGGVANSYIAGNIDESDIVGGMYPTYTITAKSGNVITLDREVEAEYLTPDTFVVRTDRSIKVTSGGRYPLGLFYGSTSSGERNIEFYNVEVDSLGNNTREKNYWYGASWTGRFKIINCSMNYLYYGDSGMYAAGMDWKNNLLSNSTSANLFSSQRHSDYSIHGNIVNGYYINLYATSTIGSYITGNILIGDRRTSLNGIYNNDGTLAKSIFRNNYITARDYFHNSLGANYDGQSNKLMEFYGNTINRNHSQFRWYPTTQEAFTAGNRFEWPSMYPAVKTNPFYRSGQTGFNKRRTLGGYSGDYVAVFNDPELSGRSHLADNQMNFIAKRLDSNEFDVISNHLIRVNGVVMRSDFLVYTEQTVRVIVELDYYNDIFIRENDWNRSNNIPRLILVGPDKRTITLRELPYQDEYGKVTFDHSFTAQPGAYSIMLTKYEGYGTRWMTYRDSSCIVKGSGEESIKILKNGFHDHLILLDKNKINLTELHQEGTQAFKNNPQRTTVKFRKIKF